MIGACTPHWCSDDLVAYDFGLFVEPERRGGLAAAGLLRGFIRWAHDKGAVDITAGITPGVHLEATTGLYQVVGFGKVGHLFSYQGADMKSVVPGKRVTVRVDPGGRHIMK